MPGVCSRMRDAVPAALGVEHLDVVALEHAGQRVDVADVVVDDEHLGAGELGHAGAAPCAGFGSRRSSAACGARWTCRVDDRANSAASSSRSAGFSVTPQRAHRRAPMPSLSAPEMTWTGMCAVCGSCLQQVEQHEAVDVGEAEVERDRVRLELARHRQRARAGGRDHALQARLAGEVEQDRGEGRVVLDDQHERIARRGRRGRR